MKYLIICAALVFAGCEGGEKRQRYVFTSFTEVYSVEIEGHKYIIFDALNKGGITHSESCECKKKWSAK